MINLDNKVSIEQNINTLLGAKKLIIVITIVITIIGSSFSFLNKPSYKSSGVVEIGGYFQTLEDGNERQKILIESSENLIKELTINSVYKRELINFDSSKIKYTSLEDRLIEFEFTSASEAESTKNVKDIIAYTENRHAKMLSIITKEVTNQLTYKIKDLNNQIEYFKNALITSSEKKILTTTNKIENLNKHIEFSKKILLARNIEDKLDISHRIEVLNKRIEFSLDKKILALDKIIFDESNNLLFLENNPSILLERAALYPTMNSIIFQYQLSKIEYENKKIDALLEIDKLKNHLKNIDRAMDLDLLEISNMDSELILNLQQEKNNLGLLEFSDLGSERIFKLEQQRNNLDRELELLKNKIYTKTQLIGKVKSSVNRSNILTNLLFSFFFGLFLSFIIIFIREDYLSSNAK